MTYTTTVVVTRNTEGMVWIIDIVTVSNKETTVGMTHTTTVVVTRGTEGMG